MLIISTDNTCHFIVVSMFLSCFGFAVTQFLFVGFTIHHSFSLSVNFMIQKGVKIFISWQVGKGELTPFALVLHPCGRRDHLVSVISLFCIDIQSWWTTRCRVEPRSFHGTV